MEIAQIVQCPTCKRRQSVSFAVCLKRGWPKCCQGQTMELMADTERRAPRVARVEAEREEAA